MKKSDIKLIIEEVIMEIVSEVSPPDIPASLHDKIVKQYGKTPKAYATMWAIHNKKNEGDVRVTELWSKHEKSVVNESSADKINAQERKKISNEMHKYSELGGIRKLYKPSEALKFITKALDAAGFQLDMVTGDILLGDKGQRHLPYSRPPLSPSEEGVRIENSRIFFAWEVVSVSPVNSLAKLYEIIAYVT